MLLLSGVATLLALVVAGWAIAGVLERFVVEGLDRRLDAELSLLASSVDANGRVDRSRLEQRISAFEQGPGWRWRVVGPVGTIGSADFPALDLGPPRPPHAPEGRRPENGGKRIGALEGSETDGSRVHARQVTIRSARGDVTLIAAAPREILTRPIRAALAPLLTALAMLAALFAAATLVQLRLGLRPVRRMRDQVAALRSGRQTTIDEDQPSELRPLAVELNALARDNEAALGAARQSAANLAHALKTPVATLALDLRDDPERAAQVARIDATIRHHLARARASAANLRTKTLVAPAVGGVVTAVSRIHAERALSFDVELAPELAVAVDPHDLDEVIGNLVNNAARYAQSRVRITGAMDPADRRQVAITVADDGPGVPANLRMSMPHPGLRLDEAGDGHGFGLSIVAELTNLYGGSLTLDEAIESGLAARVTLPVA
ncbi:MAG: HAMP domain-containing histidine kinase [Sphingomonas sp.]|uniref:ATP-binding protein n=1 Tax=Sphingomonas sp. TaxID=28214 RepID=UPI001AC5603A|nr:HAMP domain-containing sensor histidine kinase [Sphingomonas sp.]MBN8816255.1 HAMP domain-containing histidine kinase [Sphingomonas sp.]